MDTQDHTFPIPEGELHKLDEIPGERIEHTQEFSKNSRSFSKQGGIATLLIAGVAGCFLAWFLRKS